MQEFWKLDGQDYPALQKIALTVFSMAPSSSSSERNFSTFGFIHSKLRNQLSDDRVEKLVYIKTNGNLISKYHDHEEECESEDEYEEGF